MASEHDCWNGYQIDRNQAAGFFDPFNGWGRKIACFEPYVRRVMRWGIIFGLGWVSATGYYQVEHLWTQKNQLQVVRTFARCEHSRADANQQIAEEAAIGIKPDLADLPADCPHPVIK